MEKGPFSLYDFMGYFFPGALAMYLVVLGQNDVFSYFSHDYFKDTSRNFIDLPIYMILFYIIVSYCVGHFLSFFSTLTVEKYTRIMYGDPSKNLMAAQPNKGNDFLEKSKKWNFWFARVMLFLFAWPLIIFDFLAVKVMKFKHTYLVPISSPYRELVQMKVKRLFNKLGYKGDVFVHDQNNYHQLLIHYNYEFTKYHGHKLMNYVSLYGFLRVLTLISCLFCSYLVVIFWMESAVDLSLWGLWYFLKKVFWLFLLGFMTLVFYLGYLKFYKRYTLENLMLVLIVKDEV